eukprot:974327-Amphidinium_carterae.1
MTLTYNFRMSPHGGQNRSKILSSGPDLEGVLKLTKQLVRGPGGVVAFGHSAASGKEENEVTKRFDWKVTSPASQLLQGANLRRTVTKAADAGQELSTTIFCTRDLTKLAI